MKHLIELEVATPERIMIMKSIYGNAFVVKQPNGPDLLLDSRLVVIHQNEPGTVYPPNSGWFGS